MHFFFITRGVQHQVDLWKTIMQSQFFPWEREKLDKDGKPTGEIEKAVVQGALRPVQLWEYIFPEEHMVDVLRDMNVFNENTKCHQGFNAKQKGALLALRKMLGAQKIPDEEDNGIRKRMMQLEGVAVHPIGIKADKRKEATQWGYKQEML